MQCIYCIMKRSPFPRAPNKERTHLKGPFSNTKTTTACPLDATIEHSSDGSSAFRYTPNNRLFDDYHFPAPIAAFQIETADNRFSKSPS